MGHDPRFVAPEPQRSEIDGRNGATLLEFGTDWCEHCNAAQPLIRLAFEAYPSVSHVRVEDGRGRSLGRSFGVKQWPTLIFLTDGREVARLVRPQSTDDIARALAQIAAA